ncbi:MULTISPECIES: flagellar filament capping protein FliD [unclassified Gilliamella]|uniref:flagellar filament capping protein FliD n=1 Tax=unclassified Gilliamella TaxID=2685620 RepID=UPI0013078E59|nr:MULTISPECIES: flagellar filament capping protein FliD [unclassified Gilliamella]MWP49018.1 flagellar filament capping protein FliD [Gilliamella sp. Lep-s35]MWP69105.1 flagellar filament capping protein FliD [Gilliamella sp. Lep-s5]MWP77232.1 flagellar filament capping protein FliD [Gilliamella sp. Lep-s21]
MAMSALGIGSGIDLGEILNQLEAAEKTRLAPITTQQKAINAKISGFGKLKSALTTFNTATAKLQKKELFQSRTATGNNDYFSVKVNSKAALGNYAVTVDQLATSHGVATSAINDKATQLGNGNETRTITIEQANGDKLNITLSKDETSLEAIANAINNAQFVDENGKTSSSTMNAAVVRSGDGSYQLSITSKETGESQSITAISSDDEKLNEVIGFDINQPNNSHMTEVSKAQDAKFSFNGIAITSGSNTVKDVVAGVDITLKATTTTSQNLAITADDEKAEEAIKEWVEAFNQLQSTISTLTQFTADEKNSKELNNSNGPLVGDATLRNIDQSIRSIFSKGQSGEFSVLAQIGINMDKSGTLTINENELKKALSENSDAVATLFTGDGKTTGIANEVFAKVSGFIDSDGMIDSATNGLNATLKSLDKRHDQVSNSIEQTIDRYRTQFTKLDVLINSLDSMSNYLTTQFDMMANLKK